MNKEQIKLYTTADGVTHCCYAMAGLLGVCGIINAGTGDRPFPGVDAFPTCVKCIAYVQAELHGDEQPWQPNKDPTRRLG